MSQMLLMRCATLLSLFCLCAATDTCADEALSLLQSKSPSMRLRAEVERHGLHALNAVCKKTNLAVGDACKADITACDAQDFCSCTKGRPTLNPVVLSGLGERSLNCTCEGACCTAVVDLQDETAPVITVKNITLYRDSMYHKVAHCSGYPAVYPLLLSAGVSINDNCDNAIPLSAPAVTAEITRVELNAVGEAGLLENPRKLAWAKAEVLDDLDENGCPKWEIQGLAVQLPFVELQASYTIFFTVSVTDSSGNPANTSGSFTALLQDSREAAATQAARCSKHPSTCLSPLGCVACKASVGGSCGSCPQPGRQPGDVCRQSLRRCKRLQESASKAEEYRKTCTKTCPVVPC